MNPCGQLELDFRPPWEFSPDPEGWRENAEGDGWPLDDPLRCPYCGTHAVDDNWGIRDVFVDQERGDQWLTWSPCCEWAADDFMHQDFAEWYGLTMAEALGHLGYPGVRETYCDGSGVFRFALEGRAPGAGVKGWQAEVFREVDRHHSHHDAPQGWKFGVEVRNGRLRVGVATVGRPVSRKLAEAEPGALEVTRVCVWGDSRLRRNAASKLYGLCAREARKLGATKLITYTLEEEEAASVRAANFRPVAKTRGGAWNRPSRSRADKGPAGRKVRWELAL